MSFREVTSERKIVLLNEEGQKLHRAWELCISGKVLILERYGSICEWSELKLKDSGLEVYRIKKPWRGEERKESFFCRQARVYSGNQFSFIEYIAHKAGYEQPPSASGDECVQAGLDPSIELMYRDNLEKILGAGTQPGELVKN